MASGATADAHDGASRGGDTGGEDRNFVQSLDRGLAVIRSFDATSAVQTLSDVARQTGLSRATARRLLLTLERLGYVRADGRTFELTPKVLDLGYAYLSSLNIPQIAQPYLEALSEELAESVSVAVLDGCDVIYVARVPTKHIMTIAVGLGTRLPAWCTSMGRVLLAALPSDERGRRLDHVPLVAHTPKTVRSRAALAKELARVGEQGWALVDEELELGLRSISAPLRNASGETVAAMNVSTSAGRTSLDEIHSRLLPGLLTTAGRINDALAKR
jgi:IclR family transcriptional regulator, pca regulon regulatory protein